MTKTRETVNTDPNPLFHSQPPTPQKVQNYYKSKKNNGSFYTIQSNSLDQARNREGTYLRRRTKRAQRFPRGPTSFLFCIFMALICVTNGQSEQESPGTCRELVSVTKSLLIVRSASSFSSAEVDDTVTCPESKYYLGVFTICYINETWVDISSPVGVNGTCPALYVEYTVENQVRNKPILIHLTPVKRTNERKKESFRSTIQTSTMAPTETTERQSEPKGRHCYGVFGVSAVVVVFIGALYRICNTRKPKTRDYGPAQTLDTQDSGEQIPMNNLTNEDGPGSNGHIPGSSNGDLHGGTAEADAEPQGTALH
ncbi:uncharacterized protein LOC116412223 [Xenopus tropicalis]|uniref:Uncharacterized protein LOC116412223 n=1 Tax=Xenopus tropicalis TaxID=8364 RepID=A0A8J1JXR3_XENTR|nr:uncharacterized protein LOC116412223 [Xenopus tropicalis]